MFQVKVWEDYEEKFYGLWRAAEMLRIGLKANGLIRDYSSDESDSTGLDTDEELENSMANLPEFRRIRITVDLETTKPTLPLDYWRLYLNHLDHLVTGGYLQCLRYMDETMFCDQRQRFVHLLLHTDLGDAVLWAFYGMRDNWKNILEDVMTYKRGMPSG